MQAEEQAQISLQEEETNPTKKIQPLNIEEPTDTPHDHSKHSSRAKFYQFVVFGSVMAMCVFVAVFLLTGGHISLWNEAEKLVLDEKGFEKFTTYFNKTYESADEKEKRLEIYSENQQVMITRNLDQIRVNTMVDENGTYHFKNPHVAKRALT